jgi:hypothetical protein
MRVGIYLANIVVFDRSVAVDRRSSLRHIAIGCLHEGCGERTTHSIERLMFDKDCVVQSKEHAECGKQNTA